MSNSAGNDVKKNTEQWYWRLIKASIISIIVIFSSVIAPNILPYGSWLNDYFRLTRANYITTTPEHQLDITLVMIGEHFINQLPYRSPFDRCVLAAGISSIMTLNPKVLGVDLLLDGKTESYKDDLLKKIIHSYQDKLVVVLNSTEDPNIDRPNAEEVENFFLPFKTRASALLIKDSDYVVRDALLDDSGVPTFAVKLVKQYNKVINTNLDKQFQIDWLANNSGKDDAFSKIPFELFLDSSVKSRCNTPNLDLATMNVLKFIRPKIENKIVIIGVDLERDDRHLSPFDSVWHERIALSGAEIHANIAQQLIDNRKISNLHWGITFSILCLLFYASLYFSATLERDDSTKIRAFFVPVGSTVLLFIISWIGIYHFGYVLPTGLIEFALAGYVILEYSGSKILDFFRKIFRFSDA